MKRDFSALILDMRGKPLVHGPSAEAMIKAVADLEKEHPEAHRLLMQAFDRHAIWSMSVGMAASAALVNSLEGDERASLDLKARRMKLALRICEGGVIDVTVDEIAMIKERVNKAHPAATVPVRVSEHLEADYVEPPQLKVVD